MARTRSEHLWIAGGAVGAVALAFAAWTLLVSPKFSQATSLRSQTDQVRAQNASMQQNLTHLRSEYAHMGQLRAQRDQAREALPTDNNLDAFTRQIALQARAAHVAVTMMTTSDPAPVTSSAPATVAPSSSDTGSTAPITAPTGPTAAQGLYGIPVSVTVTGTQVNDVRFLDALQRQGPRAVLVSSVQMASGDAGSTTGATGSGKVAMTVDLQVFVEALPSAVTAPAAPSATPSPVAAGN